MIEPVKISDLPEVATLIERTVLVSIDADDAEKEAFLLRIRKNLYWWQLSPETAHHFKFTSAGHPIGVVLVKEFWNLCHLFVDPSRQGQGIGRALVVNAIEHCRSKSPRPTIRLNSSRNAVAFYEHLGFVQVRNAPPPYTGIQYEYVLNAATSKDAHDAP